MEIIDEKIPGVKVVLGHSFADERGFFSEIYRKPLFGKLGIALDFVQDNHSFSKKGVIRGMHFQSTPGQAKLITVIAGTIYDVFVDIRPESPHFGKWGARLLHDVKQEQLFIPVGFAHGFAVLSETAHVIYKVSEVFNPETERTFRYDDPEIGIEWPIADPILSARDRNAKCLQEVLFERLDSRGCRTTR